MKTKILSLLVLIAIAVASCQKDEADKPVVLQDVTFGIEHVDPLGLKNDDFDIVCPDDLVPVKAKVVISYLDDDNNTVTETFYPLVFFLNGKWYTQAIKLAPGDYTIEEFYLLDANDDVIMATPAKGSVYEVYVEEGVDIDFTVVEFTKIEIPIDVLCYEPARFDEFGFFWFQVDRIIVWEKCFFGDLCVKNPLEYVGSLYENQVTGLQIDMPAIFKIHAYKGTTELPYSPFTNATVEAGWGVGAPVCVEWPDNIDIAGEEFTFELWIYVAVGSGFDYVLFETWTFVDDEMVAYNGDQVIDFVLGNCGYGGTPPFLQLAPYMNLPNTATVNIAHPGNPGYWNLNISNLQPSGSYDLPTGAQTGWCGDAFTTVTPGNKTMSIYNSLYPETWPAGMPFNAATINKVNWMFNNLSNYGFPTITGYTIDVGDITQSDGLVIQDAIWYIIHNGSAIPQGYSNTDITTSIAMANGAIGNETFTPLPGGWAAILMVPHVGGVPDATKAQLIFTVVDP